MYNSETCEALNHRPRRGRKRRSIGLDASRKGGWGSSVNKYSPAYHQKLVTWTLFVITVAFILSNMPHFFMEAIMFVVIRFHLIQRLPNVSSGFFPEPNFRLLLVHIIWTTEADATIFHIMIYYICKGTCSMVTEKLQVLKKERYKLKKLESLHSFKIPKVCCARS